MLLSKSRNGLCRALTLSNTWFKKILLNTKINILNLNFTKMNLLMWAIIGSPKITVQYFFD